LDFREFLGFFNIFRNFGSTSGIFGFYLVLLEKVAEYGQPSTNGKIGILEDFWGFYWFPGFFLWFFENITRNLWNLRNLRLFFGTFEYFAAVSSSINASVTSLHIEKQIEKFMFLALNSKVKILIKISKPADFFSHITNLFEQIF
jgi:hypothetical protein